jgi:hypothetical protein
MRRQITNIFVVAHDAYKGSFDSACALR